MVIMVSFVYDIIGSNVYITHTDAIISENTQGHASVTVEC